MSSNHQHFSNFAFSSIFVHSYLPQEKIFGSPDQNCSNFPKLSDLVFDLCGKAGKPVISNWRIVDLLVFINLQIVRPIILNQRKIKSSLMLDSFIQSRTNQTIFEPEKCHISSSKKELKEKKFSKWSKKENIEYALALREMAAYFQEEYSRRTKKVFVLISEKVQSKSPDQCRSHHQKMIQKLGSIKRIVHKFLRGRYGSVKSKCPKKHQLIENKNENEQYFFQNSSSSKEKMEQIEENEDNRTHGNETIVEWWELCLDL